MIDFEALGIPKEVLEAAKNQANPVQGTLLQMLAQKAKGVTQYKSKQIYEVAEVTKWLNEHANKVFVVAILPDYKSFSYHVVYEEAVK